MNHVVSRVSSSNTGFATGAAAVLLIAWLLAPAAMAASWEQVGSINDPELSEISGIVPSHRERGLYWVHNDSLNPERIYAVDAQGQVRARVQVSGARNLDWEDIGAYEENGQAFLALADIGNNLGLDADLHIYVVPEPAPGDTEIKVAQDYRFRFEDGPRDAEGFAVDLERRRFLIVDKGRTPAGLYALPIDEHAHVARRIADIPYTLPRRAALVAPLAAASEGVFTAMDLSPDGRRLLLLTYRHALVFAREADEDWSAALARPPLAAAALPRVFGFEAACWNRDGRSVMATHEKTPAGLYRWSPP